MNIYTDFYHDEAKQTLVLVFSHHKMAPKLAAQKMGMAKSARDVKTHEINPSDKTEMNCAESIVRATIAEAVESLNETVKLDRVIVVSECNLAFPSQSVFPNFFTEEVLFQALFVNLKAFCESLPAALRLFLMTGSAKVFVDSKEAYHLPRTLVHIADKDAAFGEFQKMYHSTLWAPASWVARPSSLESSVDTRPSSGSFEFRGSSLSSGSSELMGLTGNPAKFERKILVEAPMPPSGHGGCFEVLRSLCCCLKAKVNREDELSLSNTMTSGLS